MQSDTVRWWCCSNSVDKVPPPVLERHLTYFPPPKHLYMIIWYLHSFYTRWFESGAVLGCVPPPRKLLINDCEGFLLAVLSQRLSLVASVAAPAVYTWTQPCWLSEKYSIRHTVDHMDWHICLTVCHLLLINSLATSVPDSWIKAAVNTFISLISSSLLPFFHLYLCCNFMKCSHMLIDFIYGLFSQFWWTKHHFKALQA